MSLQINITGEQAKRMVAEALDRAAARAVERQSISAMLDLELERCGWTESNRHFEDMIAATRANDDAAYEAAKARFEESIKQFPREAGAAEKAPGQQ